MKIKMILGSLIAAALMAAAPATLFAQNAPGACPKGPGYGGPPQTEEERAARQAACLERNGGVCPNGGPQANCPGYGKGQGKGGGKGLRNGTGSRAGNGTCPFANNSAPAKK